MQPAQRRANFDSADLDHPEAVGAYSPSVGFEIRVWIESCDHDALCPAASRLGDLTLT